MKSQIAVRERMNDQAELLRGSQDEFDLDQFLYLRHRALHAHALQILHDSVLLRDVHARQVLRI